MRNTPLKGLMRKSGAPKTYDFSKKKKDYTKKSKDYTKSNPDSIGSKIAKAVTPKNLIDLIPTTKVIKGGKALYNLFKS